MSQHDEVVHPSESCIVPPMSDTEPTMPLHVDVPAWVMYPEHVKITTKYGDLEMVAMGADDVFVDGTLTYRGHEYKIRYEHTDMAGQPKGYFYRGQEGQVYGVLPAGDASGSYTRKRFFSPEAPTTYVEPLLAEVAAAVQAYLITQPEHVTAALRAGAAQQANRTATTYNELATAAREALDKYEAAMAAVEEAWAK